MNVQREPVEIQKNGEPVAVVMSYQNYKELESMKLELLRASLERADNENLCSDGEAFFEELESGKYD